MKDERHETIADIVAEMRNESHAGDESCLEWVGVKMRTYADRIEAAYQRKVAELRECLKETMVIASAEYHHHSCFKHVKCGEIERCKTCKVVRWRKALKGARND